jgi:hypothetical protein
MSDEVITMRRKKELTEKAIRDGGFYGRNGVWNSIITFSGDPRLYRERVETIIVRNGKDVFVKKKMNGEYFLPGGSTEKDLPHIDQAINECQEEAHIKVRNIESTGITYKTQHKVPDWAKNECDVEWNGTFTEVYVAEYDGMYHGHIDPVDEDPFIKSGTWISTKECFRIFRKEHREALLWYLKTRNEKEEPITESYISNYFKNKKLLKKISRNPELERGAVEQIISTLKKSYGELSSKSKIQRERRQPDVKEIFHPIITLDFSDGCTITIAICFDDSEFSDGCAIRTKDYGDVVIVYPCFFKTKKDNQIFTLLHEIGHIRLNHVDRWNSKCDIFGNDRTLEYRLQLMRKGKAMYPEINADLYAVLNGASMYAILNSTINKDYDDKYDYRFTNSELATRYHEVFNKYYSLHKESEETSLSRYDIACLAIYEMTYQNPDIDYLTEEMKDELYSILYEYGINKKIKDDSELKEITEKYLESKEIFEKKFKIYKEEAFKSNDSIDFSNPNSVLFEGLSSSESVAGEQLKNELFAYKENMDSLYQMLTDKRNFLYEETCSDIKINGKGKNSKAVYISEAKQAFVSEMMDILEEMTETLEAKKENSDNLRAEHFLYIIESLTKAEREKISLKDFGIPDTRSFPLDTKKHVKSAIVLFHNAPEMYKEELAKRILSKMKKYGISTDTIGENNNMRKYM